jgi:hypothetical protein
MIPEEDGFAIAICVGGGVAELGTGSTKAIDS